MLPTSGAVLVITGTFDPTADLVIEELNRRAVPVFRADMAWFPSRLTLAAGLDGTGWRGTLTTDRRALDLSTVRAVYYRRPTSPEFPDDMPPEARAVATAEARRGFGGLLSALPCRWLPPPGRAADAEYKPLQLRVAIECGLGVPRTLITNDPDAAKQFADGLGAPVVYKPFTPIRGTVDGHSVAVYANVLQPSDLPHPDIATTAHLFQEWVPKAYEVRLTVVGQRLFAAEIHAGSAAARVDWRSDYDSLTCKSCDPPPTVAAGVLRMLAQLGLPYGAFDFVVTPSGEWWFLEVNPNGQYAFVEQATGLPITATICDHLEGINA
ncbi:ATP-grasp ribosomal peptide maturase [Kitasatospora sp. MAP5-34]|uniref:ATP-grasp ribosomal peptide maturase n=1 Tax=Kitasatospora sp. MAP5-34 TaxID=3035102 RepID=UPI0024751812|nr:ATP-grasp ribosomal peptide maturase [Kitasatospora sp. MAP5-34]MDH6577647.1 ATP-grasp ribosomal peptide maturase [Kitasatospora sp. MAP5-34]